MTQETAIGYSVPEVSCILQYKDEGKSIWQDFKHYAPDQFQTAFDELQSLDQTKYKLILRSEAAVIKATPQLDLLQLKKKIGRLLTFSCVETMEFDNETRWIDKHDINDLMNSLEQI